MASFATPQALYRLERSAIEVTSQALRNAQCWRSEVAIGVQVASFVLDRGFSEFYRSSTVSLYCRTIVAVSTSVQIRQAPSTFHPEHQVCMLVARHSWPCSAVLRVVTELYMIVRDLFQLSWLISWLTIQHGIIPAYPYVRVIPLLA